MEFVAMPDGKRVSTVLPSTSPPLPSWNNQSPTLPHIYPHSHHGTPAQEYAGFTFSSPRVPSTDSSAYNTSMHGRSYQQLRPLIMPQWPSMLNQVSQSTYHSTVDPPPPGSLHSTPSLGPLQTLISTPSTSRSTSAPRRTLTDQDRKDMCIYAEKHPNCKQTEIGAMFGVERSTVSKVLRQKEKYLSQVEDGRKSPAKKQKPRAPDIERALAVWVKNQEKKGLAITDELIRERARRFAATTTTPDQHQTLSSTWLEKFKLRHNLMGARSRRASMIPIDDESTVSTSHSPNDASPITPGRVLSPPVAAESYAIKSEDRLSETPSSQIYVDYTSRHVPGHTGGPFSESGPLSPASSLMFTPDSGTTASPFPHHRSIFPATPSNNHNASIHRPRSQTFPLLDQYMNASGSSSEFAPPVMDSPMEEPPDPLLDMSQVVLPSNHHSLSIAPSVTMRPPPIPTRVIATEGKRDSLRPVPSIDEARRALELVKDFLTQEHPDLLEESAWLGRLLDRVKLGSQSVSR